MKNRLAAAALAAMFAALPCAVQAQDEAGAPIRAMYKSLPPHVVPGVNFAAQPAGSNLTQWNGSFVDNHGATVHYTMAGLDPAVSNTTSTITALIIPVRMVYGASNGNMTFDPTVDTVPGGNTVIKNITTSPLFKSSVDFVQGGTDLGKTQYIDAYQRGNFWVSVSTNTAYHTLLKAKVLPAVTITVTAAQGKVVNNLFTPGPRGEMDINAFDAQLQGFMASIANVHPNVLPIFITDNVFLTEGGCCIGGYHSANGSQPGGQTYAHASYINSAGSFAQDVSALSHEIGEWMDDPFTDNFVHCSDNSLMENGDPLEGRANFGGFPYTTHGFTYNLQSLVFIPYFGAPRNTSVNKWLSFQNDEAAVCPGQ